MQLQKRGKQAKKGIKRQALLADNINNIFERNLNSFSIKRDGRTSMFYRLLYKKADR